MTQEEINLAFENRWRIKGKFGQMNQNSATMSFDEFFEYIKGLCKDFFETGIELGKCYTTAKPSKDNIEIRKKALLHSILTADNVQRYGEQMLQDFFDYWSEPNTSNTKMRFELQKTWDVNRRLARWARNNFNRYDKQRHITCDEQRLNKLADILTD